MQRTRVPSLAGWGTTNVGRRRSAGALNSHRAGKPGNAVGWGLPFILLLVARVPLGISDAFLMGDRSDADYNLWTILSFVFGSLAFVVHTLVLPSIKGYGWGWVPAKLAFIGACWVILMAFATFMAAFTR